MPLGVPVSDEFTGPPGAARGSETCDVANFLWSQTFLLGITGQGRLGDRMERAFFNAAPAVLTRDCRNHVYIQRPNRAVDAGGQTRYNASHHPLCCSAALNRMLPTYVTRMWMVTPDRGLALVLHGPSLVQTLVGEGVPVEISSRTAYPFEESIELTVKPRKTVAFPLLVRVPGWCSAPAITVAGANLTLKPVDGFVRIQRTWQSGDVVRLHFPMSPQIESGRDVAIPAKQAHEILAKTVTTKTANAAPYASVVYGPLLFSLPVAEGKDANTADPASAWQFALAGTTMKVERDPMPASWTWPLAAPLRLKLPAQAIDWAQATVLPKGLQPDTTATEIVLVPHGCTKLRVSMFPVTESAWRALGGPALQQRPKPLPLHAGKGVTYASDLKWSKATAGAESVLADKNYKQQPLRLGDQAIPKGIWTHAFKVATPADTVFDLQGRNVVRFRALVGLDALAGGNGSVQFQVLVDGKMKAETPILRGESTQALDVDLSGAKEITLRVLNGGDGFIDDQAVWGLARFLEPGATDVVP